MDPVNAQMVGSRVGNVVVVMPKASMTPAEAVMHAAWLATIAEALDPDVSLADALRAVRST